MGTSGMQNLRCNGDNKLKNERVKITSCWGSWFLLYSILKFGKETPFVPLQNGLGVGVVAQKQPQQTLPVNLKWFSKKKEKKSLKPWPVFHIWNIFADRKFPGCSIVDPMENTAKYKINRCKKGSYNRLFDCQIKIYITVELWDKFCNRESARLEVKM